MRDKKILSTVVLLLVAVLAFSTALDKVLNLIPAVQTVDQQCDRYLDDWTAKSITTFALTKGINSALSVVEDSDVQVTIAGSGVDLALGEAVRPLNDMIANVASVALASAVSLEIQRVFVSIGRWVGLRWLVTLSMICFLMEIWAGSFIRLNWRRLATGLLVIAVAARIFFPLAVSVTGHVGDRFTGEAYTKAQQELVQLKTEAKSAAKAFVPVSGGSGNVERPNSIKGIYSSLKQGISSFTETGSRVKQAGTVLFNRLATMASAYNKAAVTYIAVFIVQTMLLPLLILWGLTKLLGNTLNPATVAGMEARVLAPTRRSNKPADRAPMPPEAAAEA